jgi:outer membrane protein OmpA-like peptidoglycan-associated protein
MSFYFSYSQQTKDTTIIVYFKSNKYFFSKTEADKLNSFFKNHQQVIIKDISSYTDTVGSEKNNFILSKKRSEAVIKFLKDKISTNENYLVNNFGEINPASHICNACNRRVEIGIQFERYVVDSPTVKKESPLINKIVLDKLFFKPDLPVLESFSLDYLKRTAAILKTYPDAKFEIRGHVNCPLNVPANSDYMKSMNQLSEDRAKTVFEILKDNGIPAEKMTCKGMGNTEMINPYATTDDEKRQNMRVEIIILNNDN